MMAKNMGSNKCDVLGGEEKKNKYGESKETE